MSEPRSYELSASSGVPSGTFGPPGREIPGARATTIRVLRMACCAEGRSAAHKHD